jgi:4'-phosphopantetheinyl transferase
MEFTTVLEDGPNLVARSMTSLWRHPPHELVVENAAVHVWRAALDGGSGEERLWETWLSPEEKDRAARFIFPRDRRRFIAARGILRAILGLYLRRSPADIEFTYGPNGKPALRPKRSEPLIHFNLSHSHGIAAYAFADQREVGIDVEAVRRGTAEQGVIDLAFSRDEIAELHALPPELRDEAFFLGWTRKEAYLKARGTGMALPPETVGVSLSPDRPEVLRITDGSRWSLRSFEPAPGYVGAVVGEGRDWELCLWNWMDWDQPA